MTVRKISDRSRYIYSQAISIETN